MKRRTLLRGIGASTAMAVGVSASAAAMETDGDGGGPTHLATKADDGTLEVVPIGEGDAGPQICPPPEDTDCCWACPCYPCHCTRCRDW